MDTKTLNKRRDNLKARLTKYEADVADKTKTANEIELKSKLDSVKNLKAELEDLKEKYDDVLSEEELKEQEQQLMDLYFRSMMLKLNTLECICHFVDSSHMAYTAAMELIQNYPFLKSFLAGSVSGTCSTLLFQPLDLIKTRLQNSSKSGNGMITLFIQVLRNERLLGLWRGTVPSILRCVPGVGMYFSSLHWLQVNFGSSNPSSIESLCFGGLARSFAGATLLPVTVIKTRYESGVYSYSSLSEAVCKIYKNEGRKGLFSGLAATLVRDAPFSGIYLMFYTQSKRLVPPTVREHVSQTPVNFGCGIVSGILAAGITQPADVIKTKMQLYPQSYSSVPLSISLVFKESGIKGFFSGTVPRIVRRTLMATMAWTVYEQVINYTGLK